jgi:hypothetical protein
MDYEDWHRDKDPEQLWQAIIKMHKVDTTSNIDAVKDLAARKAYQSIKQGSFETLAQYSIRFRDTYKAYKATVTVECPVNIPEEEQALDFFHTVECPVNIPEEEQALDFFHGLDQGRYASFKTSMLNGWATKAFDPPGTTNDIYRIAGAWV